MLRAVCSLLVLAGVVAPLQAYGSEMIVSKDGVGQIWLQIVGTIDGGDDVKFKRMLVDAISRGEQIVNVSVYSPGGRAVAAMNIGKYIRTLHLTTVAPLLVPLVRHQTCQVRSISGSATLLDYDPRTNRGCE